MRTEKEVRFRLNTYKLVRKEVKEKEVKEKEVENAIHKALFERSITELEWMLE